MNAHTSDLTLQALYCLCRQTLPIDAGALGRLTGRSATQTAVDLVTLEQQGLVDASRARLTMLGLARAVQLLHGSSGGQAQALAMRPQAKRGASRSGLIKPPVAARPAAARPAPSHRHTQEPQSPPAQCERDESCERCCERQPAQRLALPA